MFNQLPPNGVYNGKIPCDNNQATNASVLWPARLSSTNSSRSGGNSVGKVRGVCNPCNHRSHAARAPLGVGGAAGSRARMADNSCCNQPCKTVLVQEVMPCTRTAPVSG